MTEKSSGKINKRFSDKKGLVKIVLFILVVVLMLSAMLFIGRDNDNIVTAYVKNGTITEKTVSYAYFAREHEIVKTDYSGKFIPTAAEGTRVSKGEIIGYIVSTGAEDIFTKMKSTERKLTAAQKAIRSYSDSSPDTYNDTEKNVAELVKKITSLAVNNNIESYYEIYSEIDNRLKENGGETEEVTSLYVENLTKELEEYKNELEGLYNEIKAECAGTVSFYVSEDDEKINELYSKLESCEENEKYDDISYKNFSSLGKTVSHSGKIVTEGTTVARINKEIYSYVVAEADIEFYGKCDFTSQNLGIKAKGTVLYADNNTIIMKCSTGNESFSEYNSAKVNIYISSESGMKVPVSALTDWDEPGVNARLTVVKSGLVKYIYVEILASNDEYAIIASNAVFDDSDGEVKINDTYVINYDSVYEGQPIG